MAGRRFEETNLGWMENREGMTAGQFACTGCKAIFYYVNDTDDTLPPKYCPECGRRNAKAVDT